jgi:hypothetical protein
MAKQKFDGIVEAVHYAADGRVEWVRAYERRGATFSDHVLIPRQELVDRLKQGKRYLIGQRKQYLASTFDSSQPVRLLPRNGQDVLVVGEAQAERDRLEGVPVI